MVYQYFFFFWNLTTSDDTMRSYHLLFLAVVLVLSTAENTELINDRVKRQFVKIPFQGIPGYQHRNDDEDTKRSYSKSNKIPGVPGEDYPNYSTAPETSFDCAEVSIKPGMYADMETKCQVYHVCLEGDRSKRSMSFLCPAGTVFSQMNLICDRWYEVLCADSNLYHRANKDPYKNPYLRSKDKKKKRPRNFPDTPQEFM